MQRYSGHAGDPDERRMEIGCLREVDVAYSSDDWSELSATSTLADLRFRCGAFPRSQEIRTKIGHLGFWSCVNYGNGIFCTISPGERHNYLALRLSRYRQDKQRPAAVDDDDDDDDDDVNANLIHVRNVCV